MNFISEHNIFNSAKASEEFCKGFLVQITHCEAKGRKENEFYNLKRKIQEHLTGVSDNKKLITSL